MNTNELVLIDLSSIAYPIYLMSSSEPDPNHASTKIVERVRSLATGHPHAAVCCDSGKSFRHELSPAYKANRPEREAPLHHQIDLAKEKLAEDGFPVWAVKGFEADDLIATATSKALALPDIAVLIISADKDLLQLVGPRVRAMSARDGSILDTEGVGAKFGVMPSQMRDYLTIVGDTSDNIKGIPGLGPKKAADLLARMKSLDDVYQALEKGGAGLPPATVKALKDFKPSLNTTRALVTLRTDVDIPFDELSAERVAKETEGFGDFAVEEEHELPEPTAELASQDEAAPRVDTAQGEATGLRGTAADVTAGVSGGSASALNSPAGTALMVREGEVLAAPAEWERQLDPRSMRDARVLAEDMFKSRMFSAYGTPQAVLSTVMVGRELGLPAMSSLRNIHVIEGKHGLAASLMVGIVLRSGFAEYFEPVSFSETEATFETHRKGARNPVRVTHTIEMAIKAWPKTKTDWQKSFEASGWGRNPTDMLVARATSRLARMVFPDLLAGLYTPEELLEIRESKAA